MVWGSSLMMRIVVLVVTLVGSLMVSRCSAGEPGGEQQQMVTYKRSFTMPGVSTTQHDVYFCTVMALNSTVEEWVVKFDPKASANRAHHMLLYGCSDVPQKTGYWDCGHHGVCTGGRIMYAWAKNAPGIHLPPDVGYRIGGQGAVKFLTLQIHYSLPLTGVEDHSGLVMELTTQPQQYKAGILLLVNGDTVIPPFTEKTHATMSCKAKAANVVEDIIVFGYRVHTHSLGIVVSGYKYSMQSGEFEEIAKGNPQWPQAFYPMQRALKISPDDLVLARCTFNSSARNRTTYIGSTGEDEMCNLYLMYYTDRETGSEWAVCGSNSYPGVADLLPKGNDEPLPPNPLLEEKAHGENTNKGSEVTYSPPVSDHKPITVNKKGHQYEKLPPQEDKYKLHPKPLAGTTPQQLPGMGSSGDTSSNKTAKAINIIDYKVSSDWAAGLVEEEKLGQITAVAVDSNNDVIIFHRGAVRWDGSSFTQDNKLVNTSAVITAAALLHISCKTGAVMDRWGKNFFYMTHGLTVDAEDNLWVTDVGMHQVFKFPPKFGDGKPSLVLGTKFVPGSDDTHFCKPTAVAVLKSGEFFVADGYCNSRVIKYSKDGSIVTQFGKGPDSSAFSFVSSPAPGIFNVPHSLALAEDKGEVCVADRQNGRIQCYDVSDSPQHTRIYKIPSWGSRIYAVAYSPVQGGRVYCVNGAQMFGSHKIEVFELDFASGQLLSSFSPNNQGLSYPHDLAVTQDAAELYVAEIGPDKLWKFTSVVTEHVHGTTTPAPTFLERLINGVTSFVLS
uniref:Peptidyl-glycine alpha-amidating monooxygenase B-like n=1 Tax=Hirondellea gigas TaxID=1518452 RepID=A0A6A7G7G2_9CRUS